VYTVHIVYSYVNRTVIIHLQDDTIHDHTCKYSVHIYMYVCRQLYVNTCMYNISIYCSETMLTGESRFHISTPLGIELRSLMTGSNGWTPRLVELCMNAVRLKALHRAPPPPPAARLCWLWSRKEDLQRAWNQDRRAVWDQVGSSHCRHDGLVMVQDKASLRQGHNDHSRQGHQCSEATLRRRILVSHKYPSADWTWVSYERKQTGGPLDH
jgi:hypothetical protein